MIMVDLTCDVGCDESDGVDVYLDQITDDTSIAKYVPEGWKAIGHLAGYPVMMCPRHFVDQEFLHDPEAGTVGDCWRAGIASILGLPLEDVPHFVRDYPTAEGATTAAWFDETCRWLTEHHGVTALFYDNPEAIRAEGRAEDHQRVHRLILLDGRSPRDVAHVVVGDAITGEMVHDPHPTRAGLTTVTGAFVLVKAEG